MYVFIKYEYILSTVYIKSLKRNESYSDPELNITSQQE